MTMTIVIAWIILSVPLALFPLLDVDQQFAFNYSLLMQIITPIAAAAFCYITAIVFPKGDAMRRVWMLLGAGMLCWGIGAILFAVYPLIYGGQETPYPWYSDIGYLFMAPFVLTAFFVFKKSLYVEIPVWGLMTAVVFFLVALTLSIVINFSKLVGSDSFFLFVVTLLYTVGDPLLLGGTVVTGSILAGGAVGRPWWFVLIGLVLYYAADLAYTSLVASGQYATGNAIDTGWLLGFGCIAVAASMTRELFKE